MSFINLRTLTIFRLVTFATTILFSVIVICISADLISLTEPAFYYSFSAFSLATGLISVLSLTPMYVIDNNRSGSFFSYIVVEIGWFSFLWVFWLTSGSYAAWTDDQLIAAFPEESTCSFSVFSDAATRGCHEIKAITAFSFLLWLLIMAYLITLIVLGVRAHQSGRPAWKASVRDGTILYASEKPMGSAVQLSAPPPSIPQSYPPAPQQTYTSSFSRGIEV